MHHTYKLFILNLMSYLNGNKVRTVFKIGLINDYKFISSISTIRIEFESFAYLYIIMYG